jgi:hypothetical protein
MLNGVEEQNDTIPHALPVYRTSSCQGFSTRNTAVMSISGIPQFGFPHRDRQRAFRLSLGPSRITAAQ